MNATKVAHTAGPWRAERRAHGYAIADAHGNVFANIHSYDVEGNRALVLAAPAMLAALEGFVQDHDADADSLREDAGFSDPSGGCDCERCAVARIAIRAARGARMGAHTHVYTADDRPEWRGWVCVVCGFRIPYGMLPAAIAAGARTVHDTPSDGPEHGTATERGK